MYPPPSRNLLRNDDILYQQGKSSKTASTGRLRSIELTEQLGPRLDPIRLDSDQAKNLRERHLKWKEVQERRKKETLLDPPPLERVVQLLEEFEGGEISVWCKIVEVMNLEVSSTNSTVTSSSPIAVAQMS